MAKRPKRRRRRKPQEERIEYVIEVRDWRYQYSIAPNAGLRSFVTGPYYDLQLLKLMGRPLGTHGEKYDSCEVTLSGMEGMLDEDEDPLRRSVGGLSAHESLLYAYVFVPAQRLPELVALACAGQVTRVCLTGSKIRWRSGTVSRLEINPEDEDLIGDYTV